MLLQKGIQQLKTNQFAPQQQQEVSRFTTNNKKNTQKSGDYKKKGCRQ